MSFNHKTAVRRAIPAVAAIVILAFASGCGAAGAVIELSQQRQFAQSADRFSTAQNSFATESESLFSDPNLTPEQMRGEVDTYKASTAPTITEMETELASMRKEAQDLEGEPKRIADRTIGAGESIVVNTQETVALVVRVPDVSAQAELDALDAEATALIEAEDAAVTEFNSALGDWNNL